MTPGEPIDPASLQQTPELTPAQDDRLLTLMEGALSGELQVCIAHIPLARIRPFDPGYHPELHPVAAAVIRQLRVRASQGDLPYAWVYVDGADFVLSDDYVTLAAANAEQCTSLRCLVLGEYDKSRVIESGATLSRAEIRNALGFA